jgi:hypothetical protein
MNKLILGTLEATFINNSINLMWNSSVRENAVTYLIEYEVGRKIFPQYKKDAIK